MKPKPIQSAQRTKEITYAIRDVLLTAKKAEERGVKPIYLNIGDPLVYDFQTPDHLVEAAYRAMKAGFNGYADSSGYQEALAAIRREAARKGILNVQDVFTAYGGSEAIEICLTALANPGENILLPSPGYPLYSAINTKLGIVSRFYELDEEKDWAPKIADIERKIDAQTRGIVLINPNNPTGALYTRRDLQEIVALARERQLVILADEIYDKLVFDGHGHISVASLADDVPMVTFNSLSKSYLAPGWRVGWAIVSGPAELLKDYIEATRKMTRARLCSNYPLQHAILPALEGSQAHLVELVKKLQARRDLVYQSLNAMEGISCKKPQGAFYAFPRIKTSLPDKEYVQRLIMETGVVVVHGSGFGDLPPTPHFRIVFLPNEQQLKTAFAKIAAFQKGIVD